jgi:hypothetical protein
MGFIGIILFPLKINNELTSIGIIIFKYWAFKMNHNRNQYRE